MILTNNKCVLCYLIRKNIGIKSSEPDIKMFPEMKKNLIAWGEYLYCD